jgi:hypothetical protein
MSRILRTRRALALLSAVGLSTAALACNAIIGTRDLSYDPNAATSDGAAADGNGGGHNDGGMNNPDGNTVPDGSPSNCPGKDLQNDLANCGACNHDCTGGKCALGICTLSQGSQAGLDGIEIVGTDVYAAAGDGTISRCPTKGCVTAGATYVLNSGDVEPERLHVIAGNVLFSNYNDTTAFPTGIYQVTPTVDAGVTRLTPTGETYVNEFNVLADAGTIFWGSNGDPGKGFYSCKLGNCDAGTSIEPAVETYDSLFLPNGAFVWSTDTGIHYCAAPATNCTTNTIIFDGDKGNGGWVSALAYDASSNTLYFPVSHYLSNKYPDKVQSCPASGATCTPTTYASGIGTARGMAAATGVVYWTETAGTGSLLADGGVPMDGFVNKCIVQAGTCAGGVKQVAAGLPSPNRITLDAKSVYWTNEGLFFNTGTYGSIMKAPR